MIYAATGEEGIGNGYLPRDASGHQQAGYLFEDAEDYTVTQGQVQWHQNSIMV